MKKLLYLSLFTIIIASFQVVSIVDYFQSEPEELSINHPVFWRPRITVNYFFSQLDASEESRFERAWLYFYSLQEKPKIAKKMLDWSKNDHVQKRVLSYRYFSRDNWTFDFIESKSSVSPNYYDFFINAWNKEPSSYSLSVLTEIFALSDIPISQLESDTELKTVYLNLILAIRSKDVDSVSVFVGSLGGVAEINKKAAEVVLDGILEKMSWQK